MNGSIVAGGFNVATERNGRDEEGEGEEGNRDGASVHV